MTLRKTVPPDDTSGKAPELTDKEFDLFRTLMYDVAGIQLTPVKRALVAGRLSKRLRALGHGSYRQYYDWISRSTGGPEVQRERQTAINLLTTNETYFFREPKHFDFLRDTLLPQWGRQKLRFWSAASSSGEEAYTLAMIMAVHGRGAWEIVGTDINSQVVEAAQHGIYDLARSEKIPTPYLKQCCLKGTGNNAGRFRIDKSLRQKVRFTEGNLKHDLSRLGQFDLVMLRNVLIYFDLPAKQRVLNNVLRQLKPGGYLMIGHAESLNGVTDTLRLVQPSVYQKVAPR